MGAGGSKGEGKPEGQKKARTQQRKYGRSRGGGPCPEEGVPPESERGEWWGSGQGALTLRVQDHRRPPCPLVLRADSVEAAGGHWAGGVAGFVLEPPRRRHFLWGEGPQPRNL